MLIHSSLFMLAGVQVLISGSQSKPHATQSEDSTTEPEVTATEPPIIPTTTTLPASNFPCSECGGDYSSHSGTIRHPLSSTYYQDNENCVWTITTGEPIKITFVSLEIENTYDYLYIRDGNSSDSLVLGNFTGYSLPYPVEANSGAAYLRFTSDHSFTENGFILQWETIADPTTEPSTNPEVTTTELLTTLPTTTLPCDNQIAYHNCGGDYSSLSGTIRHPMNGAFYQNNENCVWTITTGEPINITFVSLDIEDSYDYLYIRDGNSIDSRVLGHFTGSSLPGPVEINSGAAFLRFTSDRRITNTGFVLQWESSDPLTSQTPINIATNHLSTQTPTTEVIVPQITQHSTGNGHTTPEPNRCIDISPNCARNAFQCNTNTFVQRRCQKTCNLCPGHVYT